MGLNSNTIRLDNVGLISGGVGIRMDMSFPVGTVYPAGPTANYPLFLFANDLEIDFPQIDDIQLENGRVANLVNCA